MRLIGSCAGLLSFFCASTTFANLPPTALTKVVMPAYGIYVTSDPTCMTGLVATRPLSKTPVSFNFAAAPDLGGGDVLAGGIQCIVLVVQQKMTLAWAAGTYTGHTIFGTSVFNDSNCNGGSAGDVVQDQTAGDVFGCFPGQRATDVIWPDEVIADMDAAGLSYPTTCDTPGAGNVFPIYVSTYSKCTGETVEDDAIGGACHWETAGNMAVNPVEGYRANTLFQPPTAPDDAAHGVKLGGVTAGMTSYTLVIDPLIGGDGGQPGDCGILGPPKVSFRDGG